MSDWVDWDWDWGTVGVWETYEIRSQSSCSEDPKIVKKFSAFGYTATSKSVHIFWKVHKWPTSEGSGLIHPTQRTQPNLRQYRHIHLERSHGTVQERVY